MVKYFGQLPSLKVYTSVPLTYTFMIYYQQAEADEEADVLYRQLVVEVKGHDPEVMNSYKTFVTQAAKELDINLHDL